MLSNNVAEKSCVLISGGGKGFGRTLVEYFLEHDWQVATFSRSENDIEDLLKKFSKSKLIAESIDANDFEQVELFVDKVVDKFQKVDALINNAGMRFRKSFLDISAEDMKTVIDNNVLSVVNLTQLILPSMLRNQYGRIINISSILGESALKDLTAYTISKHAINGLTKSLAVEFGEQGITVNSISPGFCKTSYYDRFLENKELYNFTLSRIPMGHWGEANEIVPLCKFLTSKDANYINGAIINIDGGWSAC